jgi:hypothetical protein
MGKIKSKTCNLDIQHQRPALCLLFHKLPNPKKIRILRMKNRILSFSRKNRSKIRIRRIRITDSSFHYCPAKGKNKNRVVRRPVVTVWKGDVANLRLPEGTTAKTLTLLNSKRGPECVVTNIIFNMAGK